jgi:hypothetical protein
MNTLIEFKINLNKMKIVIFMLFITLMKGDDKICADYCLKCNGDICEKCYEAYNLKDGKCLKNCGKCEKCENGKCLKCESEYALVNDKCYSNVLITQNRKILNYL